MGMTNPSRESFMTFLFTAARAETWDMPYRSLLCEKVIRISGCINGQDCARRTSDNAVWSPYQSRSGLKRDNPASMLSPPQTPQ